MKAIICTQFGSPEVLQLREVEKPTPKNWNYPSKIESVVLFLSLISGFVHAVRPQPVGIRLKFRNFGKIHHHEATLRKIWQNMELLRRKKANQN